MFYTILKYWVKAALKLYFNKISIEGTENIPSKGPILLLCNHPASFLEACLVSCFQQRELHYLVRGDVFEKKWLKGFLEKTNQIPIYRFRDGFEKLRNNKSTFSKTFEVLAKQNAVLIFPEASTEYVPWLREIQKGAARLASGTVQENYAEDIQIIPTGVHYYNAFQTRERAILRFGKAISIRSFLENKDPQSDVLTDLTKLFQSSMNEVCVSYPKEDYRDKYDLVLQNIKQTNKLPAGPINIEQNELLDNSIFKNSPKHYYHINHDTPWNGSNKFFSIIKLFLFAFLSLPIWIFYFGPLHLVKNWANKKIKAREFYPAVRIAVSLLVHLIISLFILIILLCTCNNLVAILIFLYVQLTFVPFVYSLDQWNFLKTNNWYYQQIKK